MIKIFKRKSGKSEKLLVGTKEILKANGIADEKARDECAHTLIKANIEIMRAIANGRNFDPVLEKQMLVMREELSKRGVVDNIKQEQVILGYFGLLGTIAGLKQ
jgi:hypothetical protein